MASYTCISCRVAFADGEVQRAHYKTDWHRYNLKRKVADMPPVTAENFQERVLAQRAAAEQQLNNAAVTEGCTVCSKKFSSANAYQNHLQSHKHQQAEKQALLAAQRKVEKMNEKNLEKGLGDEKADHDARNEALQQALKEQQRPANQGKAQASQEATRQRTEVEKPPRMMWLEEQAKRREKEDQATAEAGDWEDVEEEDDDMEEDEDEDEEEVMDEEGDDSAVQSDPQPAALPGSLPVTDCLFCPHHSKTLMKNVAHMTKVHSFFIPDVEFLVDLKGLVRYLALKFWNSLKKHSGCMNLASRSAEHDIPAKVVTYINNDVIRMVMVGKTGVGKSATGNTILGREKFESDFSPESLTEQCDKAEGEAEGQKVAVIDTPGLFDTSVDEETTRKEISRCVRLASPGPHIFLIVIRLGRFTAEETNTVKAIQKIFGEGADKYSMILFTGGDLLKGKPIKKFLKKSEDLRELVAKCNDQFHVFNNELKDGSQVSELIRKIKDITKRNGGSHYTNKMFQAAERAIEEEKLRILKEKEEEMRKEREKIQKEIEKKFEGEMSKFKDDMKKQSELNAALKKEMEEKMRKMKREQEERARQEAEKMKLNNVIEAFERALSVKREEIRRLREQQAAEKRIGEEKKQRLRESIAARERELEEKMKEMEREMARQSHKRTKNQDTCVLQ